MAGASVFEGIRAYWSPDHNELYVFRLQEHLQRLSHSMKLVRMRAISLETLGKACIELVARNEFHEDIHIIPVAYVGETASYEVLAETDEQGVFMTAVARPQKPSLIQGVQVCTSSWRRIADTALPPRVKAAANYQNSRLALLEARAGGYDNAIFLNNAGTVAESTGACLFLIRDGALVTPPVTAGILESITRATLMELFRKRGGWVVERDVDRTELYLANEVFLCGSGHEVLPVVSIDHISVGDGARGPVTQSLQEEYFRIARGEDERYPEWRVAVYGGRSTRPKPQLR